MYYVLGKHGHTMVFMSQWAFKTWHEAQAYADSCNQDWKPTVVKVCEN